ncbi:MAG: GNAT family N-acetyltransferase [Acidobacteriaceae bacterium]|nr:GNAT family N-acetyltransferase [Acidobacteriaceae bacterium]
MAAATDPHTPRLVELRHVRSNELDYLLDEETATWKESLDWDFNASASLVRRFIDMQSLSGFCLLMNGQPIGYSYFVCEDRKGLIGDLYVLREFASVENESRLLNSVLDVLLKTPLVKRVESQLMMLRTAATMPLPHWRYLNVYRRDFMETSLEGVAGLSPASAESSVAIDNWSDASQEDAASLIANAYRGHVDAEINDQYRSAAGARKFLMNIVQFPGCGSFFQPASFVAVDPKTGRVCGMCLASLVAPEVGHITQICVSRSVRGKGVGYALLRRSMQSLARNHCKRASLTVTSSNREAIELYERVGFRKIKEFAAHIWDGF